MTQEFNNHGDTEVKKCNPEMDVFPPEVKYLSNLCLFFYEGKKEGHGHFSTLNNRTSSDFHVHFYVPISYPTYHFGPKKMTKICYHTLFYS